MNALRITRDLVQGVAASYHRFLNVWALPDMSYSSSVNEPKTLPSRLRLYVFCGATFLMGVTYLVVTGEVVH